MRTTSPALLLVCAGIALAMGCSSTDRPPPGSGAGASSGGMGNGGLEAGAADGGEATDLCAPLAQLGSPVSEIRIAGAPPEPLGGTITPGTYVLTEADAYAEVADGGDAGETTAGGTSGTNLRATIIVTATSIRRVGARSNGATLPPDTITAYTYVVDGAALRATPHCPAATAMTMPYSAVGGALAIFVDGSHRELYAPQ